MSKRNFSLDGGGCTEEAKKKPVAKEKDDMALVDCTKLLGKELKKGKINVHDYSNEWVPCDIIVWERGITLSHQTTEKESSEPKRIAMKVVMKFASPQEVDIRVLPDNARRSRESKLFPFAVHKKTSADDRCTVASNFKKENFSRVNGEVMNDNEIIFATSNGREMWEWASCIQWLGTSPKEEEISLFSEPATIYDRNTFYEYPDVLQDILLKMFTYKNLPENPVSFEELARIDRENGYNKLHYISYPQDFFSSHNIDDDRENDKVDKLYVSDNYDSDDNNEESYDESGDDSTDNHRHTFGLFAYMVLVGACVQVNEKCFELITSSNLYDISSLKLWKGNTPFSMLCEGDYNPSRRYMVQALWKLGYPKLDNYYAGCSRCKSFSIFLTKPADLYGVGNVVGQPVHPDDKKLCRSLRDAGDGRQDNIKLSNQMVAASKKKLTEFASARARKITAILIPQSVVGWGRSTLTKLSLSGNGIFEIPEELYGFTSLTHLNLSSNCIFGLSHKVGNLTSLNYLNIGTNLIEELPCTIEKLEQIDEFNCYDCPITTPPSAVWSRGIVDIRNFFKDMRESGTEINVDLRVLVLGLSEAGKTSLINGLVNPNARALTRVGDRTVGIEKRTWTMQRNNEELPVNLLTYDFAGQEEYYITHHLFLGSKALYIIAFDLSKYEHKTMDKQIMLWWNSIQNRVCDVKSNDSKTPKIILVGTHADMVDDAQTYADNIHKSLKKYFNLRKDDLESRLKNLEKELDNLDPRRKSNVHKEKEYDILTTVEKAQILSRESEVKKLEHEQMCTISLPSSIPAISSKDLYNFDALKELIQSSLTEVGPSGKYFPHLDATLPVSWFQVRRFVRQQSTQKGNECMKLTKYFKLLRDELNIDESVGRRATKLCHDLGDVLFFEKEDLIFLQPSFLIDTFKCIIRHDHKESTYWTDNMLNRGISEEQFNRGKDLLLQKGELEQWLLDILWSQVYDDLGESSIINNLIQLLETFDIGTSIERKGSKILTIPEFQQKYLTMDWSRHVDDGNYGIQRWVSVDQQLPHGLLKRIQVRILKKVFKRSGAKDFKLAQNAIYVLDNNLTELYCVTEKSTKECPGTGSSEGLRLYIRGKEKRNVMSLLSKIYLCIQNTLHDYPGLGFDHYIVHTTSIGSSYYIKLEEAQVLQAAGEQKVYAFSQILNKSTGIEDDTNENKSDCQSCSFLTKTEGIVLCIDDHLCSPPSIGARKLSSLGA